MLTYVGSDVITGHNYDAFGRESRKSVVAQGVNLVADFEYDLLGRTTKITYPDYTVMNYHYEGSYLDSLCSADGTCNATTTWVSDVLYDSLGREQALVDRHGTRRYEYDPITYQLTSKSYQETSSSEFWLDLSFGYDGSGRLDSVDDAHNGPGFDGIDASAAMTYDDHGRLESWSWNASARWFKYDVLGNLTGRDLASASASDNQIYDDPSKPHSIRRRIDTNKVYESDADGNVTRRGGQHLTYNSQNQLACVGTAPSLCDVAAFGYSADGTLAYESAGGETRIFVDDLFVWNASNNQAISHVFANGRQIGEQQRDNASLRSAWGAPGWTPPMDPADMVWASLGAASLLLLVLAARSGTLVVVRQRPFRASTAVLVGVAVLAPSPALAGGGSGTITRRLTHHDHLGTRVLLVSDAPDLVYRRVFEPFGDVIAESLGTEGQLRYLTGKRESTATREGTGPGLINFGVRWYDPEIGRFASIDPIIQSTADPQTHNPYGYVRNNPIDLVDPDGFASIDIDFDEWFGSDDDGDSDIELTEVDVELFSTDADQELSAVDGDDGEDLGSVVEAVDPELAPAGDSPSSANDFASEIGLAEVAESQTQPQEGTDSAWEALKEGGSWQAGIGAGYHLKELKIGPLKAGGGFVFGSGGVGADSEGWLVWGKSTADVQLSAGRFGGRAYLWDIDIGSRGVDNIDVFGAERPTWDWSIGVSGTWTPYSFEVKYDFQPLIDYFRRE